MSLKKVFIKAIDWTCYSKEHNVLDELKPTDCEICGFLIKDEKDFIVVSLEMYPEEKAFRHSLAIPKVCIKEIKVIG